MQEGLSTKHASTTAQREELERERDSADPERRAAIDAQLVTVRDQEQSMRRQLDEVNGFSGVGPVVPTTTTQAQQEQQAAQVQEPQTVFQKEVTSSNRVTGALGAFNSERLIETQVHPDIAEARLANARTAQVQGQLAAEQESRDAAKQREAEVKAVDVERAERVFEGGHSLGELGTQDHLKIESDHRNSTLEYANRAIEKDAREAAETEAVSELTEETGIEHVILDADVMIEGEIVAEIMIRGDNYFAIEFQNDAQEMVRALVPAASKEFEVGDQVQVERKLGYQIEPSYDYGR